MRCFEDRDSIHKSYKEMGVVPIFNENDQVEYGSDNVGEVSGRKRSEDAIRAGEARFRDILEQVGNIPVQGYNEERCVVFWNAASEDVYGYSKKEAIGQKLEDLIIPEEMREQVIRDVEGWVMGGPAIPAGELVLCDKEGRPVHVYSSHVMHITASGRKEMYCIDVDLRPLRHAQEALRKSESRYRVLSDNFPNGALFLIGRDFRYLAAGGKAFAWLGLSSEQVVGRTVKEIFPDLWDTIRPHCEAAFKGQESYYEVQHNGRIYSNQVLPILSNREGPNRQALVVTVDVTERKQAEEEKRRLEFQLVQAQKMEAMGTLAGGIAHDFNNILSAILGYTELALMDASKGQPGKEHLQQILKSGLRAKELVRQILNFSRRAGHERKPIQIGSVIEETLKFLRASLPTTVEIKQEVGEGTGTVLADPTQIRQVLMNLCTNAAHAMRERGGLLKVALERIDLAGDSASGYVGLSPGPYVGLSVIDTGEGMERGTLERVFEPFFTTKKIGEGTGMGLAMVHGIVKAHGGTITVCSEPGRGSTFHVYLPMMETEAEEEAPGVAKSLPGGKEHILFVDDEKTLTDIGRQFLKHLGYRVTSLTSSLEALEVFKASPDSFHLVITDQTMPKMTGVDLTKAMLSIRPDIPIIICTGFSSQISAQKAKDLGVKRFLMKPLVLPEVAKAVREVLDTHGVPAV